MKAKKGISLIVLVITILVIIVLAGAVILTVVNNNPLDKANQATVMSDRTNIQYSVSMYVADKMNSSNTDTKAILKTLWVTANPAANVTEDKIKLADIGIPDKKLSTDGSLEWYLNADGQVYVSYTAIDKVPGWAKDGSAVKAEFTDLFKVRV